MPPADAERTFVDTYDGSREYVTEVPRNVAAGENGLWEIAFTTTENHINVLSDVTANLTDSGWKLLSNNNENGGASEAQLLVFEKPGAVYRVTISYRGYLKNKPFHYKIEGLKEW
ncbi:hypothetical protein KDL29_12255 [bacterium]|nr:hypothetical protein [bacterium]